MSELLKSIREKHRTLCRDMGRPSGPGEVTDDARRWAEAVRRGCIFFYATQEVEIGLEGIDWSGAHIAHQEWPAQLNRFFCLPSLAAVHAAGEGDDLPELARRLILDWIGAHPGEPPLMPGDSLLNMSIRLGQSTGNGWWIAVARFNRPDIFDDQVLETMLTATRWQLDCLRERMNRQGNWRISELDTLITCALILPDCDKHLDHAVRMLNECFHRQIQPDGAHEEHCPSYHRWMCQVFTAFWRLARARPDFGLRLEDERVIRMWDYLVCSRAPDGDLVPLNDSSRSGGRQPPLADLLDTRRSVLDESGLNPADWDLSAQPSRTFPCAGQTFLRTSWDEASSVTAFDASRWSGWHSHLARNSVSMYTGDRPILPDPGIFSYEAGDPYSAYGRSTPAHNTINFDLMNQCEANPDTHRVELLDGMAVLASDYQGGYYGADFYGSWRVGHRPGIFGTHERILLWLGERGSVLWDFCATDRPGQAVRAHWNLPIGPCGIDPDRRRVWSEGNGSNVLVQVLGSDPPVSTSMAEGRSNPILGWQVTGKPAGDYDPSPMAVFETRSEYRLTRMATLIQPFSGKNVPDIQVTPFTCRYGRAYGFAMEWEDGARLAAAATPRLANQVGETEMFTSDGALAAIFEREGQPTRALVVDGMFLSREGQMLVDRDRAGTWLEDLPF